MCGICGFTGEQNKALLERMTSKIFHRGPDEDGFYSDNHVNLGMRRLSIIDIFSGKQPVHNENKTIWTIFNGEIYNSQSLRKDLQDKGHRFYTSHSDTEVIVHLYEEYGENFPNYINGLFAIALWDKDNKKLLLVRDRMGVKPLFYTLINDNIAFASELKSILCYPEYKKDICFEGIYHYFSYKNIPAPLTAFKGIFSLLPGELVVFAKGKDLNRHRYWKINFVEDYNHSEDDVKGRILNLLEDSVKIRMISDVPFGAYLSGGVDSSVVVALMSKFLNKPVKTFSLGYEDELQNKEADLFYARKVAKVFNTDHYEYIMSSRELEEDIDNVIKSFDQPFSGTISTYFLSKLINKHVKVALSGDGADELFGSYLAHRLAQPMFHFTSLYSRYKSGVLTQEDKSLLKPYDNNLDYLEKLYLESMGEFSRWRYKLLVFSDEEKRNLFTQSFLDNVKNTDNSYDLMVNYFKTSTTKDPLNRILEIDWNSLLPDQVLAFVDFLSMDHSVEVRSPFLDYRLVEFVSTIPGSMKINNGIVKDILKKSVKDLLPNGITERPKEGFVLPIFNWMECHLKEYIMDILSEKNLNKHGFFNSEEISSIISEYYSGNKTFSAKLWNIAMFQVWYEIYFG